MSTARQTPTKDQKTATTAEEVPREARYAHHFSLYNAINFQIILGAPMIIYARSLGASATTIGIVAALAPLLTVLQLPTASYIPRIGYKRFVLLGWFSRTIVGFGLALVPIASFLDHTTKTSLMLMCLFIFNVLRGVSTGAWLPWLTSLVPEKARGEFLQRDQLHVQLGGMLAMGISIAMLWGNARPWQFVLLFCLSACAGTLSLSFIRRIPDAQVGEQFRSSSQPVPWMEILKHPPFRKLLGFNVAYNWVVGGIGAFAIGFLRVKAGFSDSEVLACALMAFLGAFASLPLFGALMERTGCKPILRIALAFYLWTVTCWVLVSSKLVETSPIVIALVYFIMGVAGGLFSIANTRIAMNTMPLMGRNHFFSLFTVFTSVSLGLAPICWGIFLDFIGNAESRVGSFEVNRYSLYFSLLVLFMAVTFVLVQPLVEKKGLPISLALRDTVIYGRLRLLARFLYR